MSFMQDLPTSPPPIEMDLASLEAEAERLEETPVVHEEEGLLPLNTGGAQVKLELFGRPDDDLAQMTRRHLECMENNAHFPDPVPSQGDLGSLLEAFAQDCRDTRNAMKHVRMLVAQKLKSRRKLEQALNRRGNYVQLASQGEADLILSTSFGIRKKRQVVLELDPPGDIQVVPGAEPGSMVLTWSKVRHAKLYRLEYGPEDGAKTEIPLTGRRRKELFGLEIGRMHTFRIASIGGLSGQSAWSAAVRRMVA